MWNLISDLEMLFTSAVSTNLNERKLARVAVFERMKTVERVEK